MLALAKRRPPVSDFKADIWRLQAQLNTQGLVEALSDDDAGIRRRAATALRALDAFDAIPALKATLEKEGDPETRASILAALDILERERDRQTDELREIASEPAEPTETQLQIERLKTGDEEFMIDAARILGELGDKDAVEPLVVLFNYPKTPIKVRLAAAEALLKLESAPVEVALLGALRSAEWRVRRNGAAILGQLKANWAVEPLARALTDPHEMVRKTALAALKHIDTPEADAQMELVRKKLIARQNRKKDKDIHTADTSLLSDEDEQSLEDTKTQPLNAKKGEKIAWPKRGKKEPQIDPTLMPTSKLDPRQLERLTQAQKRANRDEDSTEA